MEEWKRRRSKRKKWLGGWREGKESSMNMEETGKGGETEEGRVGEEEEGREWREWREGGGLLVC